MNISYVFWLSFKNLLNRKLRTFFTAAGITLGIGAIVFLVSVGNGLQTVVVNQVSNLASLRTITVSAGTSDIDAAHITSINKLSGIQGGQSEIATAITLKNGSTSADLVVYAVNPAFFPLAQLSFIDGKPIVNQQDIVLNQAAATLLSLDSTKISPNKTLNGVLNLPQSSPVNYIMSGLVSDGRSPQAYVSLATLSAAQTSAYTSYLVQLKPGAENSVAAIRSKIEALGFHTDYVGDTVLQIERIFTVFKVLIASFGVIALVVSVVGMMNTLTVNLLEKTREVGFMKAVGVQEKDIRRLFLLEASILSFLGGTFGVILAVITGELLNKIVNIYAIRNGSQAVHFFGVSLALIGYTYLIIIFIGFITGILPARRAAKLDPLYALRYE